MVEETNNGWDDPCEADTLLDINCSDPEQSSGPKNLITNQVGSWEVFLKSQWGDGQSTHLETSWFDPRNIVGEGKKRMENHGQREKE